MNNSNSNEPNCSRGGGSPSSSSSFTLKFNLGSIRHHLNDTLKDYKGWILSNPGRASDIESFFKILAYLFPGRVRGNSTVLPELLYSTANAISFWHDHILRQQHELLAEQAKAERRLQLEQQLQTARRRRGDDQRNGSVPGLQHGNGDATGEDPDEAISKRRTKQIFRIQVALTILEYFEVFLEVTARRLWGDGGRWIIIFVMQAMK